MAELVVIVPSRRRPQNVARLAEAWQRTSTAGAQLLLAVDDDDPRLAEYEALDLSAVGYCTVAPRRRLGGTLNMVADAVAWGLGRTSGPAMAPAIGFMGDDHLPVTPGWDEAVLDALCKLGSGIVYGDDRLQGEALPTAAFMTTDIVRTLGWMVPPGLTHLYIDNAWLELGRAMGRLRYLPDVVIEHLHPAAGKAAMDAGYEEVNSSDSDAADKAAFESWRAQRLPRDLGWLRAAGLC